jgi:DNA-binding response OmpR family regulator
MDRLQSPIRRAGIKNDALRDIFFNQGETRKPVSMDSQNILIVDDDPNIRELLEVNLGAAGFTIRNASQGREAMDLMRQRTPDLVILDIMMPEMDGWEVCKQIRDDPRLERVKIIMLTAKGSEKDKLVGMEIFKADEYMTKPFDIDELIKTITTLLP